MFGCIFQQKKYFADSFFFKLVYFLFSSKKCLKNIIDLINHVCNVSNFKTLKESKLKQQKH